MNMRYQRGAEKAFARTEIDRAFEDEYREDAAVRDYEEVVYEVEEWFYDKNAYAAIKVIERLPEDQRMDIMRDNRVLWRAYSELWSELRKESALRSGVDLEYCKTIKDFFFKEYDERLDSEEMAQAARDAMEKLLDEDGFDVEAYLWLVENFFQGEEERKYVTDLALNRVRKVVAKDKEGYRNFGTVASMAGVLEHCREEIVDILEEAMAECADDASDFFENGRWPFEDIKKYYPEVFERESMRVAGIRLISRHMTYEDFYEVRPLQEIFSLSNADLAADDGCRQAARAYLVERLKMDPDTNGYEGEVEKCLAITGETRIETYKAALIDSLDSLTECVLSEEDQATAEHRVRSIAPLEQKFSELQFGDHEDARYMQETQKLDPELKAAIKRAFITAAKTEFNARQNVCSNLDTTFISGNRELLEDEDMHSAKKDLFVNALPEELARDRWDCQKWLHYFVCASDGEAIHRAVEEAFDAVRNNGHRTLELLHQVKELPRKIETILSRLNKTSERAQESDHRLYGEEGLYERNLDKGKPFKMPFHDLRDDPSLKEAADRSFIAALERGDAAASSMHTFLHPNVMDYEPDAKTLEAAYKGARLSAEVAGHASVTYLEWVIPHILKNNPKMQAEVTERAFLTNISDLDIEIPERILKIRPDGSVSRTMATAAVPRYLKFVAEPTSENGLSRVENFFKGVFKANRDVLDGGQIADAAKKGATSYVSIGDFDMAYDWFDRFQLEDSARKECIATGLRSLLHAAALHTIKLAEKEPWIRELAPDVLADIARERDVLIGAATKVGAMVINAEQQQYQPGEWRALCRVMEAGEWKTEDKEAEKQSIARTRKEIIAEYEAHEEFVITKPYKLLHAYLGADDESEAVIWDYMGQRDKHHMLEPVTSFIKCITGVESGGESRKEIVRELFARTGMGSGMQADVWRNIMSKTNTRVWKLLETTSAYPGKEPPLATRESLNLLRIQNEIKLHQTPELARAIANIPKEKTELIDYAGVLMKYPTINIEAVVRFIGNPRAFWASRSGAGEGSRVVSALLRELEPGAYPHWSAEEARDAIVEGSYDELNSFEPIAVEWSEMEEIRKDIDRFVDESGNVNAKRLTDTAEQPIPGTLEIIGTVRAKLKKADVALADKSERELDVFTWASYAVSDEVLDASVEWCKDKGEIYARKAVEYELKQKLAEPKSQLGLQEKNKRGLESRLKKPSLEDTERAQIEEHIAAVDTRIRELEQMIADFTQSAEIQMSLFTVHLDNLKQDDNLAEGGASESKQKKIADIRGFWTQVEASGFKVNVLHLAKQLAGREFANMEEFREYAVAYVDSDELAGRLSRYLDEAEKSSNIDWYQAEVLKPSNVESAIAGTLSATCDSFGTGKKAHFMINPICTQFILRQSKGRPKEWDTDHVIAQSLMTDNRQLFDKPDDRWNFFTEVANNRGNITAGLRRIGFQGTAEDFLTKYVNGEELIVLDSVEVPQNVRAKMRPNEIYARLQQAFGEIVRKNSRYDRAVRLGTQYSYIQGADFPHKPNTDVWTAPLAYSDNLGLTQHKDSSIVLRERSQSETITDFEGPINVRAARPNDALAIAMMEDIAFRRTGGDGYITGLLAMTRSLNNACIQSAHYEHAPLAYIEERKNDQGQKETAGYLIAQVRNGGDIYIDDTATTGQTKGTGTRLLMRLLTGAREDEKLRHKTIQMDCRGKTSALAISKPSSVEVLRMMGYKLEGPTHEEVLKKQIDNLIHYALVPIAA